MIEGRQRTGQNRLSGGRDLKRAERLHPNDWTIQFNLAC
jgi:hypothetical protein